MELITLKLTSKNFTPYASYTLLLLNLPFVDVNTIVFSLVTLGTVGVV